MDPLDLNLRHLHALATAAELGSISLAAEAENLSQPALTQGIAKVERQLGVALLDRRADGVTPTVAGTALILRVRAGFARLADGSRASTRSGARGFARPERLITATQLRAYLALANAGSFAAAALLQGQSQPAVHRAVRDLESLYGVPLVERRGRGVALTHAGRRLARGARLAVLELAAGLVEALPDGAADRIAIGAMPLCRALVLPHAIAAFARSVAPVAVDVREGSWRELVDPLLDGEIDVMIGALRDVAPAGLAQTPLFEDRLVIVGRVDHPLAGRTPDLADLRRYPWVVAPHGSPLRTLWQAMFAEAALPAAPIECGSVMVIRGVLRDSDFLTLLSPDQVAPELATGVLRQIGNPIANAVRTIGLTVRQNWRPTPEQDHFLQLLHAAVRATRLPENR
ncbi:DNA-binding transcriptional LysR family regulator [Sphingomonas sp. PvP055]|uniref:LysR family transcriptional regulator n=1 Tax=Sphingomonas sp. PvP055 TaxID=3156391 RepID=UPI003392C4F2